MKHELKTRPCYYQQTLDGNKNFEIRDSTDRAFQKGDHVVLREYDPKRKTEHTNELGDYTGREVIKEITYVNSFKMQEGFVAFGTKSV